MTKQDNIEDMRKFHTGTTTLGLICSDGVVLGADVRATAGTFIASSEAIKVHKIDSNLGMTIAGGVGDAQELIRIVKAQNEIYKMNENKPLSPKSAASLLSIILQENKYNYLIELLVGGIDGDVPQLYTIDLAGGSIEESKFTASGSGSVAAIGYIEDAYKKGMPTKDAVKVVARALAIAMKRDSATGDGMRITTITKGGFMEYTGKDLEKVLAAK